MKRKNPVQLLKKVLMAVVMLVCSVSALAAENVASVTIDGTTTFYTSFESAVDAVNSASSSEDNPVTISLIKDCTCTLAIGIQANKYVELYGGAFTLTLTNPVDVIGNLTIKDGTFKAGGGPENLFSVSGTLNINGGVIDANRISTYAIATTASGSVLMRGSSIVKGATKYALYISDASTETMLFGGTLSADEAAICVPTSMSIKKLLSPGYTYRNYTDEQLASNVSGTSAKIIFNYDVSVEIDGKESYYPTFDEAVYELWQKSMNAGESTITATITLLRDCTLGSTKYSNDFELWRNNDFTIVGDDNTLTLYKPIIVSYGKLTIKSGKFVASTDFSSSALIHATNDGTLIVEDGIFDASAIDINAVHVSGNYATATIKGGTYIASSASGNKGLISEGGNLTIYGGTFDGISLPSDKSLSSVLANDDAVNRIFYVYNSTNDLWGKMTDSEKNSNETSKKVEVRTDDNLVAALTIGDVTTYYTSFDDAVKYLNDNSSQSTPLTGTITLLSDCASAGFTIGKYENATLEGGDYTLTMYSESTTGYIEGSFTVNSGHIVATWAFRGSSLLYVDLGGTLTVEDGIFDASEAKADAIRVGSTWTSGTFIAKAGTFIGSKYEGYRGLVVDDLGTVTLSGGTFSGHDGGIYIPSGKKVSSIIPGNRTFYVHDSSDETKWVACSSSQLESNKFDETVKIDALVMLTRSTAIGSYGTICVPYDGVAEGATLYRMSHKLTKTYKFVFTQVDGSKLKAGVPYLYKATAEIQTFTTTGEERKDPITDNGFVGTYTRKELTNAQYFLSTDDNTFRWAALVGTEHTYVYVGQYKCYIPGIGDVPKASVEGTSSAKSVAFTYNDEKTAAINDISADNIVAAEGKYIENGKIVIVRNNKKYNTAGQSIK